MTNFKARPTTYKGIQMRSRLEAAFAAWLDKGELDWRYEPQAFADENGQYLPDFELPAIEFLGIPTRVFVEVKPKQPDLETLLAQQAIIKSSDPEAQLIAIWPDGFEFQTVLIYQGAWQHIVWTVRPDRLALDMQISPHAGPWSGEYWKPKRP